MVISGPVFTWIQCGLVAVCVILILLALIVPRIMPQNQNVNYGWRIVLRVALAGLIIGESVLWLL